MSAQRAKVQTATDKACAHCPWRVANQGKRTPDGWYTKANLRSLWTKLRRGDAMTCHPTDPTNPVSDAQQAAGHRPANGATPTRECAGALLLMQREAMVFQDYCHREEAGEIPKGSALRTYKRERSLGLTIEGLAEILMSRGIFGGVPMVGGAKMSRPNLLDEEIDYPPLDGWREPIEREAARQS